MFLSKLFRNPGKKLKTVALVLFVLIAAGGIITGLALFGVFSSYQLNDFGYFIILPLLFGSIPFAWLIALPFYAFGELVEKAASVDRKIGSSPSPFTENRSAPQPAVPKPADEAIVQKIANLKELLDQGILTQEEFELKKKELLGSSKTTNS